MKIHIHVTESVNLAHTEVACHRCHGNHNTLLRYRGGVEITANHRTRLVKTNPGRTDVRASQTLPPGQDLSWTRRPYMSGRKPTCNSHPQTCTQIYGKHKHPLNGLISRTTRVSGFGETSQVNHS